MNKITRVYKLETRDLSCGNASDIYDVEKKAREDPTQLGVMDASMTLVSQRVRHSGRIYAMLQAIP